MDQIRILDLEIFAKHGNNPEEKILGQKFYISINLFCDIKNAAMTDNISDTTNFSRVIKFINVFTQKNNYNLIETLAENLAQEILLNFNYIKEVELEVKKPFAPINFSFKNIAVKIKRSWHKVYLGLGSNLGDKQKNLDKAIEFLAANKKIKIVNISSFIITEPMGDVEQDNYLNGALEIKTLLDPHEILKTINKIEFDLGRVRTIHWGPRTIDIDILLYDDLVIKSSDLIIPHYGMHERDFVLKPMCEIAPNIMHPILNKNIYQMLEDLKKRKTKD